MPAHIRRRMLAFGSGDPTKAICSLIAQAFQHIRYPILLRHDAQCSESECLMQRHYSHFTPSDSDRYPCFKEPLNKSRMAAAAALRDGTQGAMHGHAMDKPCNTADRTQGPVPQGLRCNRTRLPVPAAALVG